MVVIPAFNEAARIGAVLERVRRAMPGYEILVIDDGSRDATGEIASEKGACVLRHLFNLGYGSALQTGYKYALRAGADLVVQMDADGQHDPAEAVALATPIETGELDLAIGSRFLGAGDYAMPAARRAGRVVLQSILRPFGLRITDPTSGFQALSRRVLLLYCEDDFPTDFPDVDVLLVAHRHGLRIGERPVRMAASPRPSLLHAGWAPVYYVYKMSLSLWAAALARRGSVHD